MVQQLQFAVARQITVLYNAILSLIHAFSLTRIFYDGTY